MRNYRITRGQQGNAVLFYVERRILGIFWKTIASFTQLQNAVAYAQDERGFPLYV